MVFGPLCYGLFWGLAVGVCVVVAGGVREDGVVDSRDQ
jgi:hypothetical protein